MKIAFVCDCIFPYHRGGRETRLYEITTRLAKLDHDVHILTMNWWKGEYVKKENGVILHGVCEVKNIYTKNGIRSIWSAIYFCFYIFFALLKEKFDVVDVDHMPFFQMYSARLALWIKNKKMFATWHEVWGKTYWQSYLGNVKGIIAFSIEKLSPLLPNKIISVSDFTSNRLIKNLRTNKHKIVTIPNGIDYQKITSTIPHNKKSDIIYIGRLLSHKNVDVLIDVINKIKNKMPDIKCHIIGLGPEFDNLKNKIYLLKLQSNIELLGYVPENEAFSYLRSSKIFISPSTREGFGIACLEAQAAGLPAIVVDHPDNASQFLIENSYNGYISQNNAASIANYALQLLNDDNTRLQMHQNALGYAKKYDWQYLINRIEKAYLNAL